MAETPKILENNIYSAQLIFWSGVTVGFVNLACGICVGTVGTSSEPHPVAPVPSLAHHPLLTLGTHLPGRYSLKALHLFASKLHKLFATESVDGLISFGRKNILFILKKLHPIVPGTFQYMRCIALLAAG